VLRDGRAGEDRQSKKRKQSHQCPLLEVGASYRSRLSGTLIAVKRALARPGEIWVFYLFRRFENEPQEAIAACSRCGLCRPLCGAGVGRG
jgi:hypothetical protein